jgi:CheY-like chemotaxis protein
LAEKFALVLMDVQMPEMDGLEAAMAIRAWEKNSGGHIPIVAMTAYAMTGDRDRCLAAGMDAYISKPIRPDELYAVLADLTQSAAPADAVPTTVRLKDALDWNAALANVRGDPDLLRELAGIFLAEYPRWLNALRDGLTRRDAGQVKLMAHTLKGSVGTFAAKGLYAAALRLETMACESCLDGSAEILTMMERELAALQPALDSFAKGGSP